MSEFAGRFAANQILGARERQEDHYAALDLSGNGHERLLFVVADGMGGHSGAATVTQLAVRRFCEIVKDGDDTLGRRLPRGLSGANDAIARAAILDGTLEGAGCAFLSATVEHGALSWISAGDCSLLLFRRGKLRKLNDDHSMRPVLAEMVKTGRLSARQAAQDPRRHSLRSALRGSEIRLIDNSPEPVRLIPGDSVILASDGFDTLSARAVARLLRRGTALGPAKMVEHLLEAILAARARNQDNATIVYYHFPAIEGGAHDHPPASGWRRLIGLVLAASLLIAVVYGLYMSTR